MDYENSACGVKCETKQCEPVDIKTSLTQKIRHYDSVIKEYQERARVKREQLKLISKDKNLEAYLNLNRRYY
jgi:hypothetical protein